MLNDHNLEKRLHGTFSKEGAELSGLAVSVIEGGEVVHESCMGRRYIDPHDPGLDLSVEADTKFRAASISKSVTAIGAMLLVERGLLDLERDISEYLGFNFRNPYFPDAPITAAMLLSHTSSVRDYGGYVLPLPWRLEDFVHGRIEGGRIAWAEPLNGRDTSPGTYFRYSNLNYGILATAMECLSGERFDRYMRKRVLEPLGIDGSYNVLDFSDESFGNLAALYRKEGEDGVWRPEGPWRAQVDEYRGRRPACPCRLATGIGPEVLDAYEIGTNGAIFSPQGGLRISIRGLSKILRLFLGEGEVDGTRLLSKESARRMTTKRWAYDPELRNGELYSGRTRETGLGLIRTTASRDEQGGDRFLEGEDLRLWGHHADAYGLLGGMAFDQAEGYGFVYLIGGTACPPESLRGRYSSWSLWEEEIQAAILEESGHGSSQSLDGDHPMPICEKGSSAPKRDDAYRTGLAQWRGVLGELGCFSLDGLTEESDTPGAAAGLIRFDPANARTEGEELIAEATSPVLILPFLASEAIPSWNAETPSGSRLDVLLRARSGGEWTSWYKLAEWSSGLDGSLRRSIKGQADALGEVKTDTLVLSKPAEALQLKVRLVAAAQGRSRAPGDYPFVRSLFLAYSSAKTLAPLGGRESGNPALWDRMIEGVPTFSQMVYPDGGKVWCSPTSLAMVMAYWEGSGEPAETSVRRTVAGVYDSGYGGCGNWSFNAAWAGTQGFDSCVARLGSLARLEPLIAAGIPLVMSLSWNEEGGRPLSGSPMKKSGGHLTLLVGFDASGDPVMNEPAADGPETVRRMYRRAELEARWLESSGGAVYIVAPRGKAIPGLG